MNVHEAIAQDPLNRPERGVTLVVVLIILVVVTLLGIGAAQIVLMSERSARYDRDYQVAWQAAEAALMDAEFDIRGPNASASSRVASFRPSNKLGFTVGCSDATVSAYRGLCLPSETGKQVVFSVDFMATGAGARTVEFGTFTGRTFDSGGVGVKPAKAPRYIIEVMDDPTPGGDRRIGAERPVLYRVSAMGFGPRDDIKAVTQIVFRKE